MNPEYQRYVRSSEWKAKARQARDHYRWQCAVCVYDWRKNGTWLDVHHLHYQTLGRERMSDLRCLCHLHHPKGIFSVQDIRMWRTSYLLTKWSTWLLFLPFRLLWRLTKWAWRCGLRTPQRANQKKS